MKKSIYLYLQRYLLKVLTKSCTAEKYNNLLVPCLLNTVNTQKRVNLVTLNLFKNPYRKKRVGLLLNFFLASSIYLVHGGSFLKKSQRHGFSFFYFVKNSNITDIYTIKSTTNIKTPIYLYKQKFGGKFNCFYLLIFRNLTKSGLIVDNRQTMFFYFYTNKKQEFFISIASLKKKIKSFNSLKSLLNLSLFLNQQLSLNKENNMVYVNKLCYIAFYCEPGSTGFRLSVDVAFLRDKTLIFAASLILLTFKYGKKKQFIQFFHAKAFRDLVNRVNFYLFSKQNSTIVENNSFESQRVLIITTPNSYIFFLRPLFSLTRFDTFHICESLKLPIYPDQSNFRVDFLRNRVRKQILPAIRVLLNPQFDTILCKFSY